MVTYIDFRVENVIFFILFRNTKKNNHTIQNVICFLFDTQKGENNA